MKSFVQEINQETERIMKAAAETADLDPIRPEYHFHSPAQWMDDPNGIIYHKGYYHMMYSLNPESAAARAGMVYKTGSTKWDPSEPDWTGGITVWGHARSKDLVHWEHLPVALFPDRSRDEYYIWFGCTAINDEGIPVAIYTSIGYRRNPTDSAQQWIAFGDDDLIRWETAEEENPIITERVHNGQKIWEWRDPYLFRQDEKAYLILGGKQDAKNGGKAVVLLYEASNAQFTQWDYRGILFEHPDPGLRSIECPNLVKIGERWVLLLSPHGAVEYFVGDIDFETAQFTWHNRGTVDYSTNFYATNVLTDAKSRRLMWGAVEGFQQYNPKGWNGINSLPRELGLDAEMRLTQRVPEEIETIRARKAVISGTGVLIVPKATLQIRLGVPTGKHARLTLAEDGAQKYQVTCDAKMVQVGPYTLSTDDSLQEQLLELYIDKSVVELFVNDREAVTLTIPPCTREAEIRLESEATVCTIWTLKTDGLFTSRC